MSSIRRKKARGFTLVEVIAALTAGLLVSMAAFLLAKNSSQFFQNEARISAAHLSATLGMNRLTSDIQRAALFGTRNMATDGRVCPFGGDPTLKNLVGIRITPGTPATAPVQSKLNSLYPDRLDIFGSFDIAEWFEAEATTGLVTLRSKSGAMKRLRATVAAGQSIAPRIQQIFKQGRVLRIYKHRDPLQGSTLYAVISAVNVSGAPPTEDVTITLEAAPALQVKAVANSCGLNQGADRGTGTRDVVVSALSQVRYEVRSLAGHPVYGQLVAPVSPEVTFDNARTELVRVEVDLNGVELPSSIELISEYAVDLKLGVSFASPDLTNPVISGIGINGYPTPANAQGYALVTDVPPEQIRAAHVRLSTRTRAPDRNMSLSLGAAGASQRLLRFQLDDNALHFARLRTLVSTIELANQAGP